MLSETTATSCQRALILCDLRQLQTHPCCFKKMYALSPPHWDFACRRDYQRARLTFSQS